MSVRVKLFTRDEELKVDESPIYVPVNLKRFGFSEVVNQLLQTNEPIPFDFLIDGALLRGSLESYLASKGLSTEAIVTVEYVRAIRPPAFTASFEHVDWVSSVHISRFQQNEEGTIATGSYDGVVRVWNRSGEVLNQLAGHQAAVLDVKWVGPSKLVSASRDRNLHIYNTEGRELSAILRGHSGPVTSIASLKGDNLVSGSQDSTLRVWTSRIKDLPDMADPEQSKQQASIKRRKVAEKYLKRARTKTSLASLSGHTAPVTGVEAHPIESDVVYSVSEDHTVKTWDLVTSKCIDTKVTGFSLLSVASLGSTTQLLACGSSARHITLVDPRSGTHSSVKQLNGHRNFVSSIAPNPGNPYQLASASHDGTVRLWDVRADKSLYTIEREQVNSEEKDLFSIDWLDILATGGRNKQLEMMTSPSA